MDEMCLCQRLFREGKLQKHVCHCDTKVNNMMFDEEGRVLCVIDLDTVMPSLRERLRRFPPHGSQYHRRGFSRVREDRFPYGHLRIVHPRICGVRLSLPFSIGNFPASSCSRAFPIHAGSTLPLGLPQRRPLLEVQVS